MLTRRQFVSAAAASAAVLAQTPNVFAATYDRSQTVDVQAEGQGLRLTIENVDAQGNSAKAVIVDFNDGKFHPVRGSPLRRTGRQSGQRLYSVGYPNKGRKSGPDLNQRSVC